MVLIVDFYIYTKLSFYAYSRSLISTLLVKLTLVDCLFEVDFTRVAVLAVMDMLNYLGSKCTLTLGIFTKSFKDDKLTENA